MAAVWLALPSLLALVGVSLATDHPVDFWLHVNTGRLMWETGTLAGRDQFTCTIAGSQVVNQNWLAELATYALYRIGGFELCQFAAAACYAAALGLSVLLAWRRSGNAHAAAWAGLAGWALAVSNFGIRPQAVSALLFATELFVLWRGAGRWGTIVCVAVIQVIWANSHGAFVLGVILPGIFLAAAAARMAVPRTGEPRWRIAKCSSTWPARSSQHWRCLSIRNRRTRWTTCSIPRLFRSIAALKSGCRRASPR